jgi:hypothetical protein
MPATLLILLAAQALPAPLSSAEPPRVGRQQVFIAPSGETFRAPADTAYPVAAWFARADADHDGKLTESEFTADFLRFIASLDANHDGTIDGAELERYEAATPELHTSGFAGILAAPSSGEEGGDDSGYNRRKVGSYMGADDPQGAGRFDLLRIPEPVASMDTSLKGRISRQQAEDAAAYRFSLLDTQHRGYLVLDELPETFAQAHHNTARDSHERRGKGRGAGNWRHRNEAASESRE